MPDSLLRRAHRARRENRLDDARRDLLEAVELSRARNAQAPLARALTRLGQIERDLGNREAARAHYQEAVSIYRTEGDVLGLAHALRHLGDIQHDTGRPDLAAPCYEEALDLYRRNVMTRRSDLADAVRSMALHKESVGDFEQARQFWVEARALYASLDGPLRRLMGRTPNAGVVESNEHLVRLGMRN